MSYFDLRLRVVVWALIGGVVGLIVWEICSGPINHTIFSRPFGPIPLIKGLFGIDSTQLARAIHIITGVVAYPLVYVWVLRPLLRSVWLVPSIILGFATWFFALGIIAPLAGIPFMLNFGALTWASLLGHMLMALGIGVIAERGIERA